MEFDIYSDDYEEWEDDAFLIEKEDWPALLKLRRERAMQNPLDLYAQQRYGEALIFNKKYSDAIDFLSPLYEENHEARFAMHEIIEALLAIGKNEFDFPWIDNPVVLRLDDDTLKMSIEFLRNKRRFIHILSIYEDFIFKSDYMDFKEEELVHFLLKHTDTFEFKGDITCFWDIDIKLKK